MGGGAGSTAALRRAGAGTRTIGSVRRVARARRGTADAASPNAIQRARRRFRSRQNRG